MSRQASIVLYKDRSGRFRWRMRSSNGKIVADSAEGYVSRRNVLRAARTVLKMLGVPARIVDLIGAEPADPTRAAVHIQPDAMNAYMK